MAQPRQKRERNLHLNGQFQTSSFWFCFVDIVKCRRIILLLNAYGPGEIRKSHFVVVQGRQRNAQKNVIRVQSSYFFWRSHCRCRRSYVSSLFTKITSTCSWLHCALISMIFLFNLHLSVYMWNVDLTFVVSFNFLRVQASVASTLIFLNKLPLKLNPVIRPIMDSIKKEEQTLMQVSWNAVILQLACRTVFGRTKNIAGVERKTCATGERCSSIPSPSRVCHACLPSFVLVSLI